MRTFAVVAVLVGIMVFAGAWFWAGRAEGPRIDIRQPERFIGQVTPLDVLVEHGSAPVQLAMIAGQAAWAAVLLGICWHVQRRAERRLVIQGG